jgi:cell division transport system permease protein
MMTAIGYSFEEAIASLRRSGRGVLVSIGTIAIAFVTLGGFLLVSVNVQGMLDRWLEAAELSVYMNDTATDADRRAIEALLRSNRVVAAVEYVPKEAALERFRADFPELADVTTSLDGNPFPSAIEVQLRTEEGGDAAAEQLAREIEEHASVADVRFDRSWLARLVAVVSSARMVAAIVTGVLMLGAVFTVGAVVRLSLHARRDELEIMELVGAPFSYIRGPFVVEGLLLGGLGAALGLITISILYSVLSRSVGTDLGGLVADGQVRFLGFGEMFLMIVAGLAVGAAAGTLASRIVKTRAPRAEA